MTRTIYCRHPRCDGSAEVIAGVFPAACATCRRPGKWSFTPGAGKSIVRWDLTVGDRRFLRSMRISPDDDPADAEKSL